MTRQQTKLPANQQSVLDRFITACREDEQVLAAFLGGSYARHAADAYSDLDLYLVTTDEAFQDFYAGRFDFIHHLGKPLFLDDFDLPNVVFYILADGTEGELGFGPASDFAGVHSGPFEVLVDKTGILAGVVFAQQSKDTLAQNETLRRLIYGFWHEWSHFVTALGRRQLWWALGEVEALRSCCVNLARLRHDFADPEVGEEAYFKIEKVMPVGELSDLQASLCHLDAQELYQAGEVLLRFYQAQAVPLAKAHGIVYPERLERVMVERFERLSDLD